MHETYLIGIDIGTGSTKAIALSEKGTVLAHAQQFYSTLTDGEKSEQDVFPVLNAFLQCIRQIVESLQLPPVAVSLSSAMHSILAVDEKGNPLTNAILWSDTRSSGVAEALRTSAEGVQIYRNTGTPLHSMSPLCKIAWFRQNEPEIFSRTTRFISIKEFIWQQLFREYVVDHSLASATGLFNIFSLRWDDAALSFAGIDAGKLSTPVPVTYTRKGLDGADAKVMKLPVNTPFFIGGSDGCLANLGSLCLQPSKAAITIGTSAAVRVTSPKPIQLADKMFFNYLLNENTFVCGGAVNNGGNVFQWLLESLFQQHSFVHNYDQLFALIENIPAGCEGLLFLPYLHGERAPVWDEKSCGVFMGLRSVHTLPFFARAAAEGVCFALLHILSSLEDVCGIAEEIAISGGVVHSKEMMQLLADVTGKTVRVQQSDDASAIGAAYVAQRAMGIINDFASLVSAPVSVFQPHPTNTDRYQKIFPVYKSLYPVLKEPMHQLYQLVN